MIKKTLLSLMFLVYATRFYAQTPSDDKKVRFGLRITPQPTWFTTNDKNNIPAGAMFGFGFGLNVEYKISDVASFLTGIGGDFEGGTYRLRHDPAGRYEASYWQNDVGDFIIPRQNNKAGSIVYILNDRKVSQTFVTIPLLLKLFTSEYAGLRYFGLFGGEVGIRLNMTSEDKYFESRQYNTDSTYTVGDQNFKNTVNIGDEGSFPVRLGLHAGAGAEYRLGGTTSVFASVSFFRSFVNSFAESAGYLTYRTDRVAGKETYPLVKQNLKIDAIRINIGLMF